MFRAVVKLVIVTCLVLCVTGCSEPTKVKLWDTGADPVIKSLELSGMQRNLWKHVPYGVKDHPVAGTLVIENDFFFVYFPKGRQNNVRIHAKKNGKPEIWHNSLYKRYYPGSYPDGRKLHGHGTKYLKVVKNGPGEIVVEHQGKKYPCTCTHRVLADKPWVEVRAVKDVHSVGIHGKVRIDIVPVEGGNDYVMDSLRYPTAYYTTADKVRKAKMVLCLYESIKYPFMWVFTFPSLAGANPAMNCDSGKGPRTDAFSWWMSADGPATPPKYWFSEPDWPRRSVGCIASTHARFGKDMKQPVVIGALTYWHNWNREELGIPIKAGQEYKSKWKPPWPGRWRMTARVAEKKYDQGWKYDGKTVFKAKYFSKDVYDGNFTFKSPEDGILDYVLMYMYDRTKDTPAEILTPMDQYRWMMEQEK